MSSSQAHSDSVLPSSRGRLSHIVIEDVTPSVDGGRYPAKRIAGERCVVEADIFRDGHQVLRAAVKWRRKRDEVFDETPMVALDNDRWRGVFYPADNARYVFTIEAWTDLFATWLEDFTKKVKGVRPVAGDVLEGIVLLEEMLSNARGADRDLLEQALSRLRTTRDPAQALAIVSDVEISLAAGRVGLRFNDTRVEPMLELVVDRAKARFGTWYEMFVRSQGSDSAKSGTFQDAERRLPGLRDLGFDVVYLAPIHPIGHTNRKGPGNTLDGQPNSPGSPWAIGSEAGGHTAIDPSIGTLADFDRFNAAANRLGMEVALDLAVQCSPDHPWVRQHPQWFYHRPDGSIKYAENPPKEYQDIFPIDFDTPDQRGLFEEIERVVRFWIDRGVKIFRVDNPHTKPVQFWNWLINKVQAANPEVIFLAEAFTRPKMMKALAKAGFTQSYTYFTWRNTTLELTEYMTELTQTPMREYFRPNFFANTPDILPPVLQTGGPAAFKMRLVLAATLSPSYGIYSGFELCERQAIPGTEEYLNSEKYELKPRDWNQPGNIKEFIGRVNSIRRDNPALQQFLNLQLLDSDNDQILFFSKATEDKGNVILVAVNLDPLNAQQCTALVPPEVVGVAPGSTFRVTDLLTGAEYAWSDRNYVRLDPASEPAHILRVGERV